MEIYKQGFTDLKEVNPLNHRLISIPLKELENAAQEELVE